MGVPEDRTETAEDQENNAKETMGKNATEEQNDEVLINIEDDGLTNNKVANGDETEAEKQSFQTAEAEEEKSVALEEDRTEDQVPDITGTENIDIMTTSMDEIDDLPVIEEEQKIETLESVNEAEQPITVEDSEFEKNSGESLHEYEMIEPDATTEEQIPTEEMHEEEILVAIENGEQNESIPVEIMTEENKVQSDVPVEVATAEEPEPTEKVGKEPEPFELEEPLTPKHPIEMDMVDDDEQKHEGEIEEIFTDAISNEAASTPQTPIEASARKISKGRKFSEISGSIPSTPFSSEQPTSPLNGKSFDEENSIRKFSKGFDANGTTERKISKTSDIDMSLERKISKSFTGSEADNERKLSKEMDEFLERKISKTSDISLERKLSKITGSEASNERKFSQEKDENLGRKISKKSDVDTYIEKKFSQNANIGAESERKFSREQDILDRKISKTSDIDTPIERKFSKNTEVRVDSERKFSREENLERKLSKTSDISSDIQRPISKDMEIEEPFKRKISKQSEAEVAIGRKSSRQSEASEVERKISKLYEADSSIERKLSRENSETIERKASKSSDINVGINGEAMKPIDNAERKISKELDGEPVERKISKESEISKGLSRKTSKGSRVESDVERKISRGFDIDDAAEPIKAKKTIKKKKSVLSENPPVEEAEFTELEAAEQRGAEDQLEKRVDEIEEGDLVPPKEEEQPQIEEFTATVESGDSSTKTNEAEELDITRKEEPEIETSENEEDIKIAEAKVDMEQRRSPAITQRRISSPSPPSRKATATRATLPSVVHYDQDSFRQRGPPPRLPTYSSFSSHTPVETDSYKQISPWVQNNVHKYRSEYTAMPKYMPTSTLLSQFDDIVRSGPFSMNLYSANRLLERSRSRTRERRSAMRSQRSASNYYRYMSNYATAPIRTRDYSTPPLSAYSRPPSRSGSFISFMEYSGAKQYELSRDASRSSIYNGAYNNSRSNLDLFYDSGRLSRVDSYVKSLDNQYDRNMPSSYGIYRSTSRSYLPYDYKPINGYKTYTPTYINNTEPTRFNNYAQQINRNVRSMYETRIADLERSLSRERLSRDRSKYADLSNKLEQAVRQMDLLRSNSYSSLRAGAARYSVYGHFYPYY